MTHVSAGLNFLDWKIKEPGSCLYVSAEEAHNDVHRLTRAALQKLPEDIQAEAAARIHAISVSGNVSLVETDKTGRLVPSVNFADLDELLDNTSPSLLVLDTFSRFFPINENDNAGLTLCFSLLERLAAKYNTSVIAVHHCSKTGSIFADSESAVKANLGLHSIRGGTAISGCVRWAVMLIPLTAGYAGKLFGPEADEKPDGCYVVGRVVKKNLGPSEGVFYLKHGEHGLFEQAMPAGQDSGLSDAEILYREVRRREEAGEPPLSATNGGRDAFLWGATRSKKAAEKAIADGLLVAEKRAGGGGNILKTLKPALF
jgi:hypothetical protein